MLSADHSYSRDSNSAAEEEANRILETSGTSPRLYRNALVFLAPDKTRLQELEASISRFLAWESIVDEENLHNLTEHQKKQARTQNNAADLSVKAKIAEVYRWLLVPHQENPQKPIEWKPIRFNGGQEGLAERASKQIVSTSYLAAILGCVQDTKSFPSRLLMQDCSLPQMQRCNRSKQKLKHLQLEYLRRLSLQKTRISFHQALLLLQKLSDILAPSCLIPHVLAAMRVKLEMK